MIKSVLTSLYSKRSFDFILSVILIPIAVPVCTIAAICIFLECRSSPFFWQVRVGLHERPFRLLKLRSMRPKTKDMASHLVDSDAILRVGRVIRFLKVDELPQLWNVIRGDMSIVGPRPGLPSQLELLNARRSENVYDLLPGITGIAQIAGLDMSTPDSLAKMDAEYLKSWSLRLDMSIIVHTLAGRGRGDAASAGRQRAK